MHPVTSPSEFIYRKPFNPAPVLLERQYSAHPLEKMESEYPKVTNEMGSPMPFGIYAGPGDTIPLSQVKQEEVDGPLNPWDETRSSSPPFLQSMDIPMHDAAFHHTEYEENHVRYSSSGLPLATLPPPSHHNVSVSGPSNEVDQDMDRRASTAISVADSTVSQTISIHSSDSDQAKHLCAAVAMVHDICLQATKTYLSSHHVNRRARASGSLDPLIAPARSPDNSGSANNENSASNARLLGRGEPRMPPRAQQSHIPRATDSLLNNVSGICNMLWSGSQRDRLDVLNVERMAVENMARLLGWAETVALGDYDEWTLAEDAALWRVVDAGRNLCAWLGVQESIHDMENLEGQLLVRGYGGAAYGA